ncbi:MAG: DUF1194 domain-containing protein [Paracoccaceae bacterium]
MLTALLACSALPAAAQASCRLALVLALDVSGSVDGVEYRLQTGGLAAALTSEAVGQALAEFPAAPVNIFVFDWAGPGTSRRILDWTALDGPDAIVGAAARIAAAERRPGRNETALGRAMISAYEALEIGPDCWRRVIDISGDGPSNSGPGPMEPPASLGPVTINALVIGADDPNPADERAVPIGELSSYYRSQVIHGPGAFVEAAIGYDDYAAAMERKLLREIGTMQIGSLGGDGVGGGSVGRGAMGN